MEVEVDVSSWVVVALKEVCRKKNWVGRGARRIGSMGAESQEEVGERMGTAKGGGVGSGGNGR